MLVNQPAIGEIVTIKLVTGEEIVGKLTERTIDSVFLAKPIMISIQPVGPKQVGLAFMPVLGSVSDPTTMQFPLSALAIRPVLTGKDVTSNYLQATTNIITPTPQQTSLLTP